MQMAKQSIDLGQNQNYIWESNIYTSDNYCHKIVQILFVSNVLISVEMLLLH
jgi:hypothetical protein